MAGKGGRVVRNIYIVHMCDGAGGGVTVNYYRKDSPFLSLEVPPRTHTPARFEMPAATGKTSVSARDW